MTDSRCSLSTEPLKNLIASKLDDETMQELADRLGYKRATLAKMLSRKRINAYSADKLAVALGLHPVEIWGSEWFSIIKTPKKKPRKGGM